MGIMRRALDLLFPRGPLWHFTGDAVLLFDSIALSLDAVKDKIDQARAESIPATALDTLPEWHSTLGIAYDPTLPLERQRNMLTAILTADGTATRDGLAYQIAKEYPGLEVIEPVSQDGLVGYWSFDNESDLGHDDSETGNNATVYGATSVPGISGKALAFDGVNDYCKILMSQEYVDKVSIPITITSSGIADGKMIMESSLNYNDNDGAFFIYRDSDIANKIIVSYRTQQAGGGYILGYFTLLTGRHHVVLSIDTSVLTSQAVAVSVDGLNVPLTYTISDTLRPPIYIGEIYIGSRAGTSLFYSGTIDEPRIYNRALSAEEVYSLYKFPEQFANRKNIYAISGTVDRIQDARRVGAIAAHFAPLHLVPTVLGFTAPTAGNPNPVPPVPSSGTSIISVSAVARAAVASLSLARCGKAS